MASNSSRAGVVVVDSRLDIQSYQPFPIIKGARESTSQRITANSKSTSNVTFNVLTPNESTVLGRNLILDTTFTVRFTYPLAEGGAASAPGFQLGVNEAPAAFPFQSFCNNILVQINNTSVNSPISDILLEKWGTQLAEEEYAQFDSMCPTRQDDFARYNQAIGARNNPLLGGDNSSFTKMRGRGNIQVVNFQTADSDIQAAGGNVSTVDVTFRTKEPLLIKPFLQQIGGRDQGLIGVNSLNINLNLDSSSRRFWSIYNATSYVNSGGSGVTAVLTDVPRAELVVNYYSLGNNIILPLQNTLPSETINRYITAFPTLNAGAVTEVTSSNIQLGTIPRKIYICCRPIPSARTPNIPLSFFGPGSQTPLKITFDNRSNLLSNFSVEQLYDVSERNGYRRGMDNFRGVCNKAFSGTKLTPYGAGGAGDAKTQLTLYTQGPVYCISPSYDLSLDEKYSEGCMTNTNISITVSIQNNFGVNLAGELLIITEDAAVISTTPGKTDVTSVLCNTKQVVDAKMAQQPGVNSNELRSVYKENFAMSDMDALGEMMVGPAMGSALSGGSAKSDNKLYDLLM